MNASKTLVIVTHPNIDRSTINKRWLEELENAGDTVTVHQLHRQYPDEKIDVRAEQALLLSHDNIVFQFPFYWFSTPPLLKKWLDDVLTHGFAYGSDPSQQKMTGKRIGFAISTGSAASHYEKSGRYAVTINELLRPFELTVNYINAEMLPIFTLSGAAYNLEQEDIASSAADYLKYIQQLSAGPKNDGKTHSSNNFDRRHSGALR